MTHCNVGKAILICLLASASAAPLDDMTKEFQRLEARKEHIVSMPMHVFDDTCGAYVHLPIKPDAASLLQQQNVPGAGVDGMDKFEPFKKVLKDGFALTTCVKDYMYYSGDKFGDNKHDYKLGPVSDVSIVHYDAFVAKEDRQEMTQKVCFEFCRTVPNMGFFGIVNGRGCYCTPYFTPSESDSTQCDAVCEGDKTLMCGGKSKSSIFSMHMCDSTEDDLSLRSNTAGDMKKNLDEQDKRASGLSKDMQGLAEKLQKSFGAVGDSGATGHMQEAKVFAGTLVHKAEDAAAVAGKLGDLIKSASSLKGFSNSDTVTKAERIMEGIDETLAEAEAESAQLYMLTSLATGEGITSEKDPDSAKNAVGADEGGYVWADGVKFGKGGNTRTYGWTDRDFKQLFHTVGPPKGGDALEEAALPMMKMSGFLPYYINMKVLVPGKKKVEEDKSAIDQYYPVMYFVDKEFENVPTTCSGSRVGKPIVGESAWGCAAACDDNIHSCVGFQYFEDGDNKLCFLLSGFSTGSYYTGCGKAFLQANAAPFDAKCYAKLSKFEGTTLKPNPSGKCAQCFKDLTKADRCYK